MASLLSTDEKQILFAFAVHWNMEWTEVFGENKYDCLYIYDSHQQENRIKSLLMHTFSLIYVQDRRWLFPR